MPNSSKNESPPPWPAEVMRPDLPDWERTAIKWLWELLPAHHRDQWLLVTHPHLLARQAYRQVEGEIYMLRYRGSSHSELASLRLSPGVIEEIILLDAEEFHRLLRVKEEIRMVARALALPQVIGNCHGNRKS
ncbi:hypothetical protein [Streptomyces sp. AK02-04a]|uniref:hypothetical protein n=1 Tax=Streptomyces sp. AK02-04a TaxID=3028649 RepID=UPI0029B737AD|nr:hypothetical protein [Streptomyces sp. AK02-04a]MDX3764018.1 hypothetical protein [Streptomyces sp. AK02-04a]